VKKKSNQRIIKRELRKAKAELSMLISYLSDCEDAFNEYSIEWNYDLNLILKFISNKDIEQKPKNENLLSKNVDNNNFSHSFENKENIEDCEIKSTAPEWVKKTFRKIALKTHPDKIKDKTNAKDLENLYAKANSAIMEENYDALLEICNKLSINVELDPEEEIKHNVKRQEQIKKNLKDITESLPWVWCESSDNEEIRKKILISVLPHYGISLKSNDVLNEALEKIKSE